MTDWKYNSQSKYKLSSRIALPFWRYLLRLNLTLLASTTKADYRNNNNNKNSVSILNHPCSRNWFIDWWTLGNLLNGSLRKDRVLKALPGILYLLCGRKLEKWCESELVKSVIPTCKRRKLRKFKTSSLIFSSFLCVFTSKLLIKNIYSFCHLISILKSNYIFKHLMHFTCNIWAFGFLNWKRYKASSFSWNMYNRDLIILSVIPWKCRYQQNEDFQRLHLPSCK